LKKSNYEELIMDMIKRGLVLDHSKSPCEENFIPEKKVRFIVLDNVHVISFLFFSNILKCCTLLFI
jgi:hypothetical protein